MAKNKLLIRKKINRDKLRKIRGSFVFQLLIERELLAVIDDMNSYMLFNLSPMDLLTIYGGLNTAIKKIYEEANT